MRTTSRTFGAVVAVATSLWAIAGCGGGGDQSDAGSAGEDVSDDAATTSDDAASDDAASDDAASDDAASDDATSDDAASDDAATTLDDAAGDDAASDDAASGGPVDCDELFSIAEVEQWFAEPASLTEDSTESLGQTVCTWETIEDPEDLDDLAFELIVAQVYSGDPIAGSNFVDPDIFEDVTMIDGIGDLAFASNLLGTDYAFLDGDVAGFFSATEVNMGDPGAAKRHTAADVEAMFRLFHERVMGG